MSQTADVVVVGGGVNGASIAYALAARGVNVVLLEKGALASGASGRSSALVRMHYTNEWDARLAWASFPVFKHWAELMGGPPVFSHTGFVNVVGPAYADNLRLNVEMLQGLGVNTTALTAAELKELQPFVNVDDIGAAAYEPDSGYANPAETVEGFRRRATELGARVLQWTAVTGVVRRESRVTGVDTSAGRIAARVDAPGRSVDSRHPALPANHSGHCGPLEDAGAQLGRPASETLHRLRGVGVAAVRLIRRGADIVDIDEGLELLQLRGRERCRVDAQALEHLDVEPEIVRVGRPDDIHEARVAEDGGPAHELGPVLEHGEARPGQAGIPLVRVVHPDEGAGSSRRATGQRALLEEHDVHAAGGQRVGDARAVHAPAHHHHVGCLAHRVAHMPGMLPQLEIGGRKV